MSNGHEAAMKTTRKLLCCPSSLGSCGVRDANFPRRRHRVAVAVADHSHLRFLDFCGVFLSTCCNVSFEVPISALSVQPGRVRIETLAAATPCGAFSVSARQAAAYCAASRRGCERRNSQLFISGSCTPALSLLHHRDSFRLDA